MPITSPSHPAIVRRLIVTALFAAMPLTLISATEGPGGGQPQVYPYTPYNQAHNGNGALPQPQYPVPARRASNTYPRVTSGQGPVNSHDATPLEQELQQLRLALQQNQAELAQSRQDLRWMQQMMQQVGQTLEWLQYRQEEYQQREQQLREQLAGTRQQDPSAAAAEAERVARLTRENARLREQLAEKEDRLARVSAELGRLQGLLQESRSESASLQQQLSQTRSALASVQPAAAPSPASVTADADGDGVADGADLCPDSGADAEVSPLGCAAEQPLVLEGVKFEYDSEAFTPDSRPALQQVADRLKQHPELRLEIAGHTDAQGHPAYNEWLSEQRANTVRTFLIDNGIPPDRLTAKGYGQAEPIADNDTWKGIQKNRRVELRLLP